MGGKCKKNKQSTVGRVDPVWGHQAKPVFRVLFTPMLEDKYKWSFIATQQ